MDGFIIIGNKNAITYKEVFPLIKDNKVRLGYTNPYFEELGGNGLTRWYVTFPVKNKPLVFSKSYNPEDYPKYDNYDAIEVGKVTDIPKDYDGVMGVPLTFLGKYNPNQFEILDVINRYMVYDYFGVNEDVRNRHSHCANVGGKATYVRILIRKVKELPTEEEVKNSNKKKRY